MSFSRDAQGILCVRVCGDLGGCCVSGVAGVCLECQLARCVKPGSGRGIGTLVLVAHGKPSPNPQTTKREAHQTPHDTPLSQVS